MKWGPSTKIWSKKERSKLQQNEERLRDWRKNRRRRQRKRKNPNRWARTWMVRHPAWKETEFSGYRLFQNGSVAFYKKENCFVSEIKAVIWPWWTGRWWRWSRRNRDCRSRSSIKTQKTRYIPDTENDHSCKSISLRVSCLSQSIRTEKNKTTTHDTLQARIQMSTQAFCLIETEKKRMRNSGRKTWCCPASVFGKVWSSSRHTVIVHRFWAPNGLRLRLAGWQMCFCQVLTSATNVSGDYKRHRLTLLGVSCLSVGGLSMPTRTCQFLMWVEVCEFQKKSTPACLVTRKWFVLNQSRAT